MIKKSALIWGILIGVVFLSILAIPVQNRVSSVNQSADSDQTNFDEAIESKEPIDKIRILIVPGHEPDLGGAEFKKLKERNMVVDLSDDLKKLLDENSRYEVFIARDKNDWHPIFKDYFEKNWDEILAWQKDVIESDLKKISAGEVAEPKVTVRHNKAPKDVAARLYGFIKWANENKIDIIIHVHINDDAVHKKNVAGKYSGFAIYVPVEQYENSKASRALADKIFDHLKEVEPVSDIKGETDGIIDEPRLIAIGPHNSLRSASLLIEYGYIYEKKFANPTLYVKSLRDMASATYYGLEDFFENKEN